jgi:hypothetical protein
MTSRRSVQDVTYDLLRALGLTTVFGNPGSTEETFLKNFPDDFTNALGLQEASVLAMADGFAQSTGKPALVNVHTSAGTGTLDELLRYPTEHGVDCAAIPAEAIQRTVCDLIANASGHERSAVRHNLPGLEVALPDGQNAARFGGENMKDVAGCDTKRLFIGSRSTFGTITSAIFKIAVGTAQRQPTRSQQTPKESVK